MNAAAPAAITLVGDAYDVEGYGLLPRVSRIIRAVMPFIPRAQLEAGAERGTKVHEACEFIDAGFADDVDPSVRGYADAYKRFLAETGFTIVKSEYKVANPPAKYAGTIDRVGTWQGDTCILDIKSGQVGPDMQMQLAAYAYAYWLMESGDAKVRLPKCMLLQLFDDGTYKVHEFKQTEIEAAFQAFLGLAKYARWKDGLS